MHSNHSLFNATPQVWTFFKYKIDEDDLEKEIYLVNFDLLMKKIVARFQILLNIFIKNCFFTL